MSRTVPPERLMAWLGVPVPLLLKALATDPRSSPPVFTVTVVALAVVELAKAPAIVTLNLPELMRNCVPVARLAAAVPSRTMPLPTKVIVRAVPPSFKAPSCKVVLAVAVLTAFRVALPDRVTAPVVSCAVPLVAKLPACTVNCRSPPSVVALMVCVTPAPEDAGSTNTVPLAEATFRSAV